MKAFIKQTEELILEELDYEMILKDNNSNTLILNTEGSTFTVDINVDPVTRALLDEFNFSNITSCSLEFKEFE